MKISTKRMLKDSRYKTVQAIGETRPPVFVSAYFIFQPQIISDHGDEFGVCGFAAVVLDRVTEI